MAEKASAQATTEKDSLMSTGAPLSGGQEETLTGSRSSRSATSTVQQTAQPDGEALERRDLRAIARSARGVQRMAERELVEAKDHELGEAQRRLRIAVGRLLDLVMNPRSAE